MKADPISQSIAKWLAKQDEALRELLTEDIPNASPIERLLVLGLLLSEDGEFIPALHRHDVDDDCKCIVPVASPAIGRLHFQHPVSFGRRNYRLDFALFGKDFDISIAIECDGHDFHEKTKEQAARDKARERDLVGAGWLVLRFAGSELWRDPEACGDAVVWTYINEWTRRRERVGGER
jgi:very-short-patch-repair endonuclease